jgi:hypothetical protein
MTPRRPQRERQLPDTRKRAGTCVADFNAAWNAFRQYLATLDWVALNGLHKRVNVLRRDKSRRKEIDWARGLSIPDAEMAGRIMQPSTKGGLSGTDIPNAYFDEIDRRFLYGRERPTTVAREIVMRNHEPAASNEQTLKNRVDYIVKLWKKRNPS